MKKILIAAIVGVSVMFAATPANALISVGVDIPILFTPNSTLATGDTLTANGMRLSASIIGIGVGTMTFNVTDGAATNSIGGDFSLFDLWFGLPLPIPFVDVAVGFGLGSGTSSTYLTSQGYTTTAGFYTFVQGGISILPMTSVTFALYDLGLTTASLTPGFDPITQQVTVTPTTLDLGGQAVSVGVEVGF